MKTLTQLALLMLICLLGEVLADIIPFAVPGTILALLLLLLLLLTGILKLDQVSDAGDLLLKHMSIFFIPAGVKMLAYLDIIRNCWIVLLLVITVTTVITFVAAALAVRLVLRLTGKES